MTSEENPTSSNILELDKIKIDETINKDGQYEDEGVFYIYIAFGYWLLASDLASPWVRCGDSPN